ncbi:hypothetical protein AMATHDRAFT_135780 [Amanita thiersii Skay4041]|uniref:Monopolin complex subunit Csm1/Pcs1 C-terminal domain-containing protein n=1 Tax=Amanita thiersii Skay4041 TaxID=703135 RepID=A0A2A9NVK0_9AGAR|nr:hypothetical protein AMATHDRAFT_135780 [Amanita thiersii Skay4041]
MKSKVKFVLDSLTAQEVLIKELTSQLAQKETLTLKGKDSILHMITREAADEEKRLLEKELAQLKDVLAGKTQKLKEKDKLIAELEQREREARFELNVEIERSKTLADKSAVRGLQAAPRSRTGAAGLEDSKNVKVIRFYEDITNLLVTNMRHQAGQRPGQDEWTFTCIYTYSENGISPDALQKSLSFTLRTSRPEAEDTDEPGESLYYVPQDLDKEPPEFVSRLGFLNHPFTFERKQLSLFLRTLHDSLKEALSVDSDGEKDDEVQVVE